MQSYVCFICKETITDDEDHKRRHILQPAYVRNCHPLSFVISSLYGQVEAADTLALGRQELKRYFPDKEFEIQPGSMTLRRDRENSNVLGTMYVTTYLVFEK